MTTKQNISIQVPANLKEALAVQAAGEEMDLSKLIRRILKKHIATGQPVPMPMPDVLKEAA
jgi:antitoxin component of RelBE/YafQ-DinJ toxin-antitoxin module